MAAAPRGARKPVRLAQDRPSPQAGWLSAIPTLSRQGPPVMEASRVPNLLDPVHAASHYTTPHSRRALQPTACSCYDSLAPRFEASTTPHVSDYTWTRGRAGGRDKSEQQRTDASFGRRGACWFRPLLRCRGRCPSYWAAKRRGHGGHAARPGLRPICATEDSHHRSPSSLRPERCPGLRGCGRHGTHLRSDPRAQMPDLGGRAPTHKEGTSRAANRTHPSWARRPRSHTTRRDAPHRAEAWHNPRSCLGDGGRNALGKRIETIDRQGTPISGCTPLERPESPTRSACLYRRRARQTTTLRGRTRSCVAYAIKRDECARYAPGERQQGEELSTSPQSIRPRPRECQAV